MEEIKIFETKCIAALDKINVETIEEFIGTAKTFLDNKDLQDHDRAHVFHILGTLFLKWSDISGEDVSSWRSPSGATKPRHIATAINHFREGLSLVHDGFRTNLNAILHLNLAVALKRQQRTIEALDAVQEAIRLDQYLTLNHIVYVPLFKWFCAICNLIPEQEQHFQHEAYLFYERLQSKYRGDVLSGMEEKLKGWIKKGKKNSAIYAKQQSGSPSTSYGSDEVAYRQWCLQERLFINPLNELTTSWNADGDTIRFPQIVYDTNKDMVLTSAFSQILRDYCFARHLAYEGIHNIHPTYEDRLINLHNTQERVNFSGSTAKVKAAFNLCFGVFDSLATLMNNYFGFEPEHVAFSPKWISANLKKIENSKLTSVRTKNAYYIDALYWQSCDLVNPPKGKTKDEKWDAPRPHKGEKWDAPRPQSAELRRIRNAIEHGWLKIAENISSYHKIPGDYAHVLTTHQLHFHTRTLFKLVRSTLFYVVYSVGVNEIHNVRDKKREERLRMKIPPHYSIG